LGTQVKRLFSIYSDSRLEFKKTYNLNHNLLSRLGVRYQHNKAEQDYTLGYNSATDELISVQNGNNALRQTGGGIGEWNWMNAYFNFDYGFKNKLFFSFNTALDGSSRFGTQVANGVNIGGNSFALMPSLGAAWLISSEKFMATSSFDMMKLRINYSYAGNDDIGNYSSRQTYSSQNLLGMQGLVRSGIPNPAIQWETNKKFNIGLDLAFWNERVNLSVDAYRNKTENMLVYENIAAQTGFDNVLTNGGSMLNTGIEAGFNINVVNKKKLKWDIGATIASNKNKILSVPNGSLTTQFANASILTQNNSAATLFYGYTADGVFSSNLEASNANLRMKNSDGSFSAFKGGDVKFKDFNGDRIIDEKDRKVIGNPTPDFFGSINSRLVFGRLSLTTLFVFSQGNDVYNYLRYKLESASTLENQLNSVVNRWRAEGQSTSMPRATFGDPLGNNRFSTRWIEDGSYLSLRNASLNYAIPFKDKFIKNASIYLSGDNLFTLTKYSGFNPEFSASNTIFAQGIDMGLNPLYKTLTIGARIGL
jgi:TonB-linked SusC/RagA family outer membrane protein